MTALGQRLPPPSAVGSVRSGALKRPRRLYGGDADAPKAAVEASGIEPRVRFLRTPLELLESDADYGT